MVPILNQSTDKTPISNSTKVELNRPHTHVKQIAQIEVAQTFLQMSQSRVELRQPGD